MRKAALVAVLVACMPLVAYADACTQKAAQIASATGMRPGIRGAQGKDGLPLSYRHLFDAVILCSGTPTLTLLSISPTGIPAPLVRLIAKPSGPMNGRADAEMILDIRAC